MTPHFVLADFEPIAGLSMRDSRPFQAGDSAPSHNVEFPPSPAAFVAAAGKIIRASGDKRRVAARGFALAGDGGEFFPAPLDLHFVPREEAQKHGMDAHWTLLAPYSSADPVIWRNRADVVSQAAAGRFLPTPVMAAYLRDRVESPEVRPLGSLPLRRIMKDEVRTGTALDGRQAAQGQLYSEQVFFLLREGHYRFRLGLEVTGEAFPGAQGILKLGGEARLAHAVLTDVPGWQLDGCRDAVQKAILSSDDGPLRAKLCLLTPAVFSTQMRLLREADTPAWRPNWLKPGGWVIPPFAAPYQVRLVATVAGKPFPLGFWDSGRQMDDRTQSGGGPGAPKPLYRCLPAGSVFYLEIKPGAGVSREAALTEFFDRFWLRSMLTRAAEDNIPQLTYFGKSGFGWTAIGGWNYVATKH